MVEYKLLRNCERKRQWARAPRRHHKGKQSGGVKKVHIRPQTSVRKTKQITDKILDDIRDLGSVDSGEEYSTGARNIGEYVLHTHR